MPHIYVASLADYNAGRLHGVWIDATQDAHDIRMCIMVMLHDSAEPVAEEWAIHDYEEFGPVKIGEYDSIEYIAALASALDEHGWAFGAFLDNMGYDKSAAGIEEAVDGFRDAYCGCFNSLEDYAYEYIEETGSLSSMPESLRDYFDYEAFARDMEIGGDIWTAYEAGEGYHIFRNN